MQLKSVLVVPVCVQLHINNYGIPWSTLHDHVARKYEEVGKGGPTVLTSIEEREIALTCMTVGDMGFVSLKM